MLKDFFLQLAADKRRTQAKQLIPTSITAFFQYLIWQFGKEHRIVIKIIAAVAAINFICHIRKYRRNKKRSENERYKKFQYAFDNNKNKSSYKEYKRRGFTPRLILFRLRVTYGN